MVSTAQALPQDAGDCSWRARRDLVVSRMSGVGDKFAPTLVESGRLVSEKSVDNPSYGKVLVVARIRGSGARRRMTEKDEVRPTMPGRSCDGRARTLPTTSAPFGIGVEFAVHPVFCHSGDQHCARLLRTGTRDTAFAHSAITYVVESKTARSASSMPNASSAAACH